MRTSVFGASFGSNPTPTVVRYLIWVTAISSIVLAIVDTILYKFTGWIGIQYLMSLSWIGLTHGYIWQPVTHLFVMQPFGGISLGFLISLGFQMYILWFIGSYLTTRFGAASFLRLYLGSGTISSLLVVWMTAWSPLYPPLTGCIAPLFAIFVVWAMLNPNSQLFLFFVIPIQTKWLLAGALGANALINLSEGDLIGLLWAFSGASIGYLYGSFWHGLNTPFPQTHALDDRLATLGSACKKCFNRWKQAASSKGKIVDLKTGKPIVTEKEEKFVNQMLEKISKEGEDSLSWWQRRKLNQIAKKKHKK